MATVVITFFLLVRFYVYKMDAEFIDRPRSGELSRREKRWSMNSQRLEEIVAELMKPISDVRRSFDTDLSSLLEEYLTEAGLHALEAGEAGAEMAAAAAPNFAELALLLQHSASVYGRKVDCLYQHVLSVSDSLQNTSQELERGEEEAEGAEGAEAAAEGGRRQRKRAWAGGGWQPIELAGAAGAAREAGRARPPPTLPRVYLELEPRAPPAHERALADYDGQPLGQPHDYHVLWRLQGGMLVDELEEGWGSALSLRPIPLMELQAALAAAAPPPPPPLAAPPSPAPRDDSPPRLPRPPSPLAASTPLPPAAPAPARDRKRKHDGSLDVFTGRGFKLHISQAGRKALSQWCEFSVEPWARSLVALRATHISNRRRHRGTHTDFHGFESSEIDMGGFAGWSPSEAAAATAELAAAAAAAAAVTTPPTTTTTTAADGDSDDDGFFEQSSLGDSDGSRPDDNAAADNPWWWASRVSSGGCRPPDVRSLAGRVLSALPSDCRAAAARPALEVFAAAGGPQELPALFLASLFLANAGNVEIIQGPPLTVNSFSVRYVTSDPRLYCAADLELVP